MLAARSGQRSRPSCWPSRSRSAPHQQPLAAGLGRGAPVRRARRRRARAWGRAAARRARPRRCRRPCSDGPCRRVANCCSSRVLADPHLPQRAVAAQRHRHHLVDEVLERPGRPVDVTIDREGGVVDPLRRVQAQRDRRELLAVARRAPEPQLDVIAQLGEARQRPVGGRREDRDPADVHVRGGRLHREERRVERRQARAAHLASASRASRSERRAARRARRPARRGARAAAPARAIGRRPHSAASANSTSRSK